MTKVWWQISQIDATVAQSLLSFTNGLLKICQSTVDFLADSQTLVVPNFCHLKYYIIWYVYDKLFIITTHAFTYLYINNCFDIRMFL